MKFKIIKARRGHLDSIERGPHGTFASTGGRGSQGGKEPANAGPGQVDNPKADNKKPEKGSGKVGKIDWLSKTEQMHKPVPKKPLKNRYGGDKRKPSAQAEEGKKSMSVSLDVLENVLKSANDQLAAASASSGAPPSAPSPSASGLKELGQALIDADAALASGTPMEQLAPQLQTVAAGLSQIAGMGDLAIEPDGDELPVDAEPATVLMSVKSMGAQELIGYLGGEVGAIKSAMQKGDMKNAACRKFALMATIKSVYQASFDKPVHVAVYKDAWYKEPPKTTMSISAAAAGGGARFIDPKGKVQHPGTKAGEMPHKGSFYETATKSLGELEQSLKSLEVQFTEALKSEWATSHVNDLPDSAFLYVAPGGNKDEGGKTVPRELRHFPVRDAAGKPDLAHIRNALSRIPQSDAPNKDALAQQAESMLKEAEGQKSAAPAPAATTAAPAATTSGSLGEAGKKQPDHLAPEIPAVAEPVTKSVTPEPSVTQWAASLFPDPNKK